VEPYLSAGRTAGDTVSRLAPDLQVLIRQAQITVSSAIVSRP
jgi:hypothetical protein